MTNKEKVIGLLKLADALEATKPERFYMGTWAAQTSCGTACCIAGLKAMLDGRELVWRHGDADFIRTKNNGLVGRQHIRDYAVKALGLTALEQEKLFYAEYWDLRWRETATNPTPHFAAVVVRLHVLKFYSHTLMELVADQEAAWEKQLAHLAVAPSAQTPAKETAWAPLPARRTLR